MSVRLATNLAATRITETHVGQHAQPDRPARRGSHGCFPVAVPPRRGRVQFVVYLVAVVGVLSASYLVGDGEGRGDVFLAGKAWFSVTLLTIGYMLSRGLAKAGIRERYDA